MTRTKNIESSRIIYGCMRIVGDNSLQDREKGKRAIHAAMDSGINHFDHADIYGKAACEELFGEVLQTKPSIRDKILITDKCGIRRSGEPNNSSPKRYDFSYQHIVSSVEASLKRLRTDYIDSLLLHRPDFLMNTQEVAKAFDHLKSGGKVLNFGVSNFTTSQLSLLQQACDLPIKSHQIEISLHNTSALTDGRLDQCQLNNIVPQAWSPLGGALPNAPVADYTVRLNTELQRQSKLYGEEPWIIVLAWLLKHPSNIHPIIGTTNAQRIQLANHALNIEYGREDWYRLLEARIGSPVA